MRRSILFSVALGLTLSSHSFANPSADVNGLSSSSVFLSRSVLQHTVKGRVVSADGPLDAVTVSVVGGTVSTMTDTKGEYSINAPIGATLRFTSVGYKAVEIMAATSVANVSLESDGASLDEVVVTAMGIKKEKKALGYSVQDIGSEELMKNKTANLVNSLAGKIAGVNVTQTSGGAGAGASIILRGGTSLERDNQPLFVVDGLIYDNSTSINGNSLFDGAQSTNSVYSNRVMDIKP